MTQNKSSMTQSKGCVDCWFKEGEYCTYFIYKKQPKKKIPENVLEKGCKFFTEEVHPLFKMIIEKFDGILI